MPESIFGGSERSHRSLPASLIESYHSANSDISRLASSQVSPTLSEISSDQISGLIRSRGGVDIVTNDVETVSNRSRALDVPTRLVCVCELIPRVSLMSVSDAPPTAVPSLPQYTLTGRSPISLDYWLEEMDARSLNCVVFQTGTALDSSPTLSNLAMDQFKNQFLLFPSPSDPHAVAGMIEIISSFAFWYYLDKGCNISIFDVSIFNPLCVAACLLAVDSTQSVDDLCLLLSSSVSPSIKWQPSDKRYLSYIKKLLLLESPASGSLTHRPRPVMVKQVLIDSCFCSEKDLEVLLTDSEGSKCLNQHVVQFYDDETQSIALHFPQMKSFLFRADVALRMRSRRNPNLCLEFRFNTGFIDNLTSSVVNAPLTEWDLVDFSTVFPNAFHVQIITVPATNTSSTPIVVSPFSLSVSSTNERGKLAFADRHVVHPNAQLGDHFRQNNCGCQPVDIVVALKISENRYVEATMWLFKLLGKSPPIAVIPPFDLSTRSPATDESNFDTSSVRSGSRLSERLSLRRASRHSAAGTPLVSAIGDPRSTATLLINAVGDVKPHSFASDVDAAMERTGDAPSSSSTSSISSVSSISWKRVTSKRTTRPSPIAAPVAAPALSSDEADSMSDSQSVFSDDASVQFRTPGETPTRSPIHSAVLGAGLDERNLLSPIIESPVKHKTGKRRGKRSSGRRDDMFSDAEDEEGRSFDVRSVKTSPRARAAGADIAPIEYEDAVGSPIPSPQPAAAPSPMAAAYIPVIDDGPCSPPVAAFQPDVLYTPSPMRVAGVEGGVRSSADFSNGKLPGLPESGVDGVVFAPMPSVGKAAPPPMPGSPPPPSGKAPPPPMPGSPAPASGKAAPPPMPGSPTTVSGKAAPPPMPGSPTPALAGKAAPPPMPGSPARASMGKVSAPPVPGSPTPIAGKSAPPPMPGSPTPPVGKSAPPPMPGSPTPALAGKSAPPPMPGSPAKPSFGKASAPPMPGSPALVSGKSTAPPMPGVKVPAPPMPGPLFTPPNSPPPPVMSGGAAALSNALRKAPPLPKAPALPRMSTESPPDLSRMSLSPPDVVDQLPLGRKLHWKPIRNVESTIWATMEDSSGGADFSGLKTVFDEESKRQPAGAAGLPRSGSGRLGEAVGAGGASGNAPGQVVTLLEAKRAQNIGVVVARVPVELVGGKLQLLSTEGLSIEMLDRLKMILPTDEEAALFTQFKGDVKTLRDIEQKIIALFKLSRLTQRIRFCCTSLQLPSQLSEVTADIALMQRCAEEIRSSGKLKKLLHMVLLLGNYVNHNAGAGPGAQLKTKGFSVESLSKLMEFKSPTDPNVTTLHFLAAQLITSDPELVDVYAEVPTLKLVGKTSSEAIVQAVNAAKNEPEWIKAEVKTQAAQYTPDAVERMTRFVAQVQGKVDAVVASWATTEKALVELRKFFGEDPRKLTAEDFFGHFRQFLDLLLSTCADLKKRPKKFEKILAAQHGDASGETPATNSAAKQAKKGVAAAVSKESDGSGGSPKSSSALARDELSRIRKTSSVTEDGSISPSAMIAKLNAAGGLPGLVGSPKSPSFFSKKSSVGPGSSTSSSASTSAVVVQSAATLP